MQDYSGCESILRLKSRKTTADTKGKQRWNRRVSKLTTNVMIYQTYKVSHIKPMV